MLASSPAEAPPRVGVISPQGAELRPGLQPALVEAVQQRGLPTAELKLSPRDGSVCGASVVSEACVDRIRRRWSRAQPPLMVLGSITDQGDAQRVELLVLSRDEPQPVARFDARFVPGDLVLPVVFPLAVARAIDEHLHPPAPITDAEREQMAGLDEPAGLGSPGSSATTAEPSEPAAEPSARVPAESGSPASVSSVEFGPGPVADGATVRAALRADAVDEAIHLREDFSEVCRRGPRRRSHDADDSRDLRPRCGLGPTLGYVRPRTWVLASLAVASGVASGLAFAAHGDGSYGESTRRKAGEWGTATAATSAVLGVSALVSTLADRRQARQYLEDERWFARR